MPKILVVDDSMVNVKLVRESLKLEGFTVIEANSGQEALKKAARENPEAIFLDIRMADINGVEVMKKLKATPGFEKTPMIAITACTMEGDREKLLAEGFDDYISKPVSLMELIEKAKRYCPG